MKTFTCIAGLVVALLSPVAASAQQSVVVVNVPTVNTPTLNNNTWQTYLKTASQLSYQVKQWQMEYYNFQHYGTGSWLNLSNQLTQIEAQVQQQLALKNGNSYGADAQVQQQLLAQDLAVFQDIQRMNDNAVGSLQVQQATNYFLNAMVSDSLKQRKLQIDQAMMEAQGRQNFQVMWDRDLDVDVRP